MTERERKRFKSNSSGKTNRKLWVLPQVSLLCSGALPTVFIYTFVNNNHFKFGRGRQNKRHQLRQLGEAPGLLRKHLGAVLQLHRGIPALPEPTWFQFRASAMGHYRQWWQFQHILLWFHRKTYFSLHSAQQNLGAVQRSESQLWGATSGNLILLRVRGLLHTLYCSLLSQILNSSGTLG